MKTTYTTALLSSLLFLAGCADPLQPALQQAADGGHTATTVIATPVEVTPTTNGYVCYCRIRIPLNCTTYCLPTLVDGQMCDSDVRALRVCLPAVLNPNSAEHVDGSHVPTAQEMADDCSGRVARVIRQATRLIYSDPCNDAAPNLTECSDTVECSAVRMDGSIDELHTDTCDAECPTVPVEHGGSVGGTITNPQTATCVAQGDLSQCEGEPAPQVERLCGDRQGLFH